MLNFCSLYSGSSGNSLFIETENTKIDLMSCFDEMGRLKSRL